MINSRAILATFAISTAPIAACSFNEQIADHAVEYNESLAQVHNSSLLLNALRAKDRSPMHFTGLSEFNGSYVEEANGQVSAEIPLGGDADSVFPISPSVRLVQRSNPTFTMGVLDSKSFITGILSPIKMKTVKFYVDQGWPFPVLFYSFIQKVEIEKAPLMDLCKENWEKKAINNWTKEEIGKWIEKLEPVDGKYVFYNSPPDPDDSRDKKDNKDKRDKDDNEDKFNDFQILANCIIDEFKNGNLSVSAITTGRPIGPKLPVDGRVQRLNGSTVLGGVEFNASLKSLVEAEKGKITACCRYRI